MQNTTFIGSLAARRGAVGALTLFLLGCLIVQDDSAFAADAPKDAPKSWTGTWTNKKFNTTGALTCTVLDVQDGKWIAKFTGTALGKPISYTALMTPKPSGANTALSGVTKVDGFDYQWSATLSGKSLNGTYRASNGNNGDFRLQAK